MYLLEFLGGKVTESTKKRWGVSESRSASIILLLVVGFAVMPSYAQPNEHHPYANKFNTAKLTRPHSGFDGRDVTLPLKWDHARTKDYFLGQHEGTAHEYTKAKKGRILELQLGPTCPNDCFGCKQRRVDMGPSSFLSTHPKSVAKVAEMLGVSDDWRIQLSGARSDPLTASSASLRQIIGMFPNNKIIMHTSAFLADKMIALYSDAHGLFDRKGEFVLVQSHNAPVSMQNHNRVVKPEKPDQYLHGIGKLQFHLGRNRFGAQYIGHILALGMIRNLRATYQLPTSKFHVVHKQLIYLEDSKTAPFSIEQKNALDIQRKALLLANTHADTIMIAPAFFEHRENIAPMQNRFVDWLGKVVHTMQLPGTELMYRTYGVEPQRHDRSGVSEYQYTISRAGYFTPCDYSEVPLPNLPRIDNPQITKQMVDEARSKLSYDKEPCRSCSKQCQHDYYE